ncbi:MAG: hypothetical protein OIN85_00955 [Candidatus Methanoperedens sp.]|nr:hypothetical protein [Candidatus Methanoperedens sp.]
MCVVCKEWEAGKLTNKEAIFALGELMSAPPTKNMAHYSKVLDRIMEKELPTSEKDEEMDRLWNEETHEKY